MQKIERNFLIIVILLVLIIVGVTLYYSFSLQKIDRNSYATLLTGTALLNEKPLEKDTPEKLNPTDEITTQSEDALLIIEWGDGSVTRIGAFSKVKISELYVSDNKDKINISFNLLGGKSWSNVVSFIGNESYFNQSFMDLEASVRGTVFNVDLDKNYLYVIESKVELFKSNGESILVNEQEPINLSNLLFIRIDEFIKSFRDNSFDTINRIMDSELYLEMQEGLMNGLSNFNETIHTNLDNLTERNRNLMYKNLMTIYQELNFVNPTNSELYETKLNVKEKLIELAPEDDKVLLLDSLANDLTESLQMNSEEFINKFTEIFTENIGYASDRVKSTITDIGNRIELPENFKQALEEKVNSLKSLFNIGN